MNGLIYLAHLDTCNYFMNNFFLLSDSSIWKSHKISYMVTNNNTCHVFNQCFSILSMIKSWMFFHQKWPHWYDKIKSGLDISITPSTIKLQFSQLISAIKTTINTEHKIHWPIAFYDRYGSQRHILYKVYELFCYSRRFLCVGIHITPGALH